MAVSTDVTLASVLGTLVGRTDVDVFTLGGFTFNGPPARVSVVGQDVLILSPGDPNTVSNVIPFNAIDHVNVPNV
ncbi:MAG: hypothetical protein ACM3ZC_09055 [Bacteroidota bacterium]